MASSRAALGRLLVLAAVGRVAAFQVALQVAGGAVAGVGPPRSLHELERRPFTGVMQGAVRHNNNRSGRRPFGALCAGAGDGGAGAAADRAAAKEAFLAAARAGPKNGVGASPEQRAAIEGRLAGLIAFNPTEEPAVALLRPPFKFFDGTYAL